jgi:hypothetical protein
VFQKPNLYCLVVNNIRDNVDQDADVDLREARRAANFTIQQSQDISKLLIGELLPSQCRYEQRVTKRTEATYRIDRLKQPVGELWIEKTTNSADAILVGRPQRMLLCYLF